MAKISKFVLSLASQDTKMIGAYDAAISEISISLELLNNSLKAYSLENKKDFLLGQFWSQLEFEFRGFIKDGKVEDKVKGYGLKNIQETFKNFHSVLW